MGSDRNGIAGTGSPPPGGLVLRADGVGPARDGRGQG